MSAETQGEHLGRPRGQRIPRACGRSAAVLLIAVVTAALTAATAGAQGGSYVAMGDSYTSGPGLAPASSSAPADCGQSQANYPHLVAAALGLSLTDASCAGARTEDFTVAQHPDQPPQFASLAPTTAVVSVSMTGNDHGLFGTLVQGCTETDAEDVMNIGAPCKRKYGQLIASD